MEPTMKKTFTDHNDFKFFCKKLTTQDRKNLMKIAEKSGVQWNRNPKFRIDWMRAAMKISEHIKQGNPFTVPLGEKYDVINPETNTPSSVEEHYINTVSNNPFFLIAKPLNLDYKEDPNGGVIIGEGFNENKPGRIKLTSISNFKNLSGLYALTEYHPRDSEMIKNKLDGLYDFPKQAWYIPVTKIIDAIKLFGNVEIEERIVPQLKRELETTEYASFDLAQED